MAKSEETEGKMRVISEDDGKMNRFVKTLIWILVFAVLILGTLCYGVRTDGMRNMITEWLEKKLDMELTVKKTRIGFPYVLVLEDVESETPSRDKDPDLYVRELRIGLGGKTKWKVHVNKCVLNLSQNRDRNWNPSFLATLGNLPEQNIVDITYMTEDFRRKISLHVQNSSVRWLDRDGETIALVRGLYFDMTPVKLPSRKMYHYNLAIDSAQGFGADKIYDVEKEWMADGLKSYVEVGTSGREVSGTKNSFWEADTLGAGARKKVSVQKKRESEEK